MLYSKFKDKSLSRLGMGTMRLPQTESGEIDKPAVKEMVSYAIEHGINYFDTAYPYHNGMSEVVVGEVLSEYPRESFYLATKYPGHQVLESYDPAGVFEEQLKKCGVEYFDFYLLHNVNEKSIGTYMNEEYGILDYFLRQKELGRIRHLGFSSHGSPDNLKQFLDYAGDKMEFCQLQLNYLDWSLQDAKSKYEMCRDRSIPVIVMEPVRGGLLAKLEADSEDILRSHRADESAVAWAFRFLMGLEDIAVILSGMSDMEQLKENVEVFECDRPLDETELNALMSVAQSLKCDVPCTKCRYCTKGCPAGLDIPKLLEHYVEAVYSPSLMFGIRMEAMEAEGCHPKNCIGCGACEQICPQNIKISEIMADFTERVAKIPRWDDICKARREAAKKAKK